MAIEVLSVQHLSAGKEIEPTWTSISPPNVTHQLAHWTLRGAVCSFRAEAHGNRWGLNHTFDRGYSTYHLCVPH